MSRRTCIITACLLLIGAAALGGRPASAQTWTISTLDSAGNVGQYIDLVVTPSGGLGVLYSRSDDHTLKYIASSSGVWGAAQVVDASGFVGTSLSLAVDASGNPKVGYRRTDEASLWYAGPEALRTWATAAIVQTNNVGQSLTLLNFPAGDFAVAYRNVTAGSLQMVERTGGVWGTPVTVDPGPNRGLFFDISYRSGAGYIFSEYAPDNGALMFADPQLHMPSFTIQQATSQTDNVGTNLNLWQDADGSFTAAYRNVTQGSLQYVRRTGGVWGAPVTVDPGPNRGLYFDITYRPGAGYCFSEYSPQDGALLHFDPILQARSWAIAQVPNNGDNVGPGLSLLTAPDGTLAASYRDVTEGTLQHIRWESGAWTAPVTVDNRQNRGQFSDIARMPDGQYCFSEYEPGQGSLLLAHPSLTGRSFASMRVDAVQPSGKQLSVFQNAAGRLDCVYLTEETGGRLRLLAAEIAPGVGYTIRAVADSVSMTNTGFVTPDAYVTAGHGWTISYRKAGPNDLYVATTDNFELLPADAPDAPEDDAASTGRASDHIQETFPNPTPAAFRVRFSSSAQAEGELTLFDTQGRLVRRIETTCRQGENVVPFDGRNDSGEPLARGVYFLRVRVGERDLGKMKIVMTRADR
jgi:hypothetical protein